LHSLNHSNIGLPACRFFGLYSGGHAGIPKFINLKIKREKKQTKIRKKIIFV